LERGPTDRTQGEGVGGAGKFCTDRNRTGLVTVPVFAGMAKYWGTGRHTRANRLVLRRQGGGLIVDGKEESIWSRMIKAFSKNGKKDSNHSRPLALAENLEKPEPTIHDP